MALNRNGQKGQSVTEAVLFLALIVFSLNLLIKGLKNMSFVEGLTVTPWERVSGMIECGVWKPCGVKMPPSGLHPSNRVVSYKPPADATGSVGP